MTISENFHRLIHLPQRIRGFAKNWMTVLIHIYVIKKFPVVLKFYNSEGYRTINDPDDWWAIRSLWDTFGKNYDVANTFWI